MYLYYVFVLCSQHAAGDCVGGILYGRNNLDRVTSLSGGDSKVIKCAARLVYEKGKWRWGYDIIYSRMNIYCPLP